MHTVFHHGTLGLRFSGSAPRPISATCRLGFLWFALSSRPKVRRVKERRGDSCTPFTFAPPENPRGLRFILNQFRLQAARRHWARAKGRRKEGRPYSRISFAGCLTKKPIGGNTPHLAK